MKWGRRKKETRKTRKTCRHRQGFDKMRHKDQGDKDLRDKDLRDKDPRDTRTHETQGPKRYEDPRDTRTQEA